MIGRVAPFGLLLLAAALFTGCQDKPAGLAGAPRITLPCDRGVCTPSPDHLPLWPKEIVVVSTETWESHTVFPPDSEVPLIELRSKQNPARIVHLPVIDAGGHQPAGILPVASLAAALLVLMAAGAVAYFSWDYIAAQHQRAINVDTAVRDSTRMLVSVADTLAFPAVPEPRQAEPRGQDARGQAAPEPPAAPRGVREIETLNAEILQFVKYAKDCFVGLGKPSEEALRKIRDLERLASQLGRDSDADMARAQYAGLARTLSRLALRATDDDFSIHGTRNPTAEAALGALFNVAGYTLLAPKPLEKFSERRHSASGRTERAEARNQHGYIARVERRGLLDSNNEVIEKAEVVLYDYRSY